MKCTAILLLATCLHVCAIGHSQSISLSAEHTPLKKVFKEIQQQTGFHIVCEEALMQQSPPLTFKVNNGSLEQVLGLCFPNTPFSFTVIENTVILKTKDDALRVAADTTITVSGKVTDDAGAPLIGASVHVKGSNKGVTTSETGTFSVGLPSTGGVLDVSFVGYDTKAFPVPSSQKNVNISLVRSVQQISEVTVVTALGIGRKATALSYATQQVSSKELTTVKSTNVLNSLNGKVSGVQINRTSGGAGGSVRMVIRGDKSTRNSQPLYVIDGMPVLNPTGGASAEWYNSTADGGDILSTINPEDIESINILKGPSASSLYGSQGSNGVVLITTKKGKAGVSRVDVASSLTLDNAYDFPKQQFNYGQTTPADAASPGSEDSWGAKGATGLNPNYIKDFFNTGVTLINSANLTWGSDRASNYLSFSNTDNKGIVPTSTLKQNSLSFRQSAKFLNDKLLMDASFMGSIQDAHNRINPGVYFNPLTGLYAFPRGLDFDSYKQYEYFSNTRYLNAQNWWNINTDKGFGGQDYQQNPYWVLHRDPTDNRNQNAYAAISLKYAVNDWLSIQARGNYNNFQNSYQRSSYATTQSTLAPDNGLINVNKTNNTTLYGDLVLQADHHLAKDLNLNATLGTSIQDQKGATTAVRGALKVPNVFLESAIDWSDVSRAVNTNTAIRRQIQSVFAAAELSYQDKIFLNLTDRNDWSSTLAYTPSVSKGFNYYSAGVSAILSRMIKMSPVIDLAKLRVSYAIVGNDIDPFRTDPLYTFNAGISKPPTSNPIHVAGYYLQPEKNRSFEAGTQWALLGNRLSLDLTYYKSNITNQFFENVSVSPGLGAGSVADVNGGNIQNTGVELAISYGVVKTRNFNWTTAVNISQNKNKVVELFNSAIVANPSPDQKYALSGGSGFLVQGGSFGDIYGRAFQRDGAGHIMIGADSMPLFVDNHYLGNPNPRTIIGWNNTFTLKDFTFSFLVDAKLGGKIQSVTEALMDQMGVSKRTGDIRDQGGKVSIPNVVNQAGKIVTAVLNAEDYYKAIGGKGPVGEAYMYSASAVRLREVSISWRAPLRSNTVKDLRIGLIGNNLFFFYKKAPTDPEQVAAVNPGGVGVDVFGLPVYRSMGLSVKCGF